MIPLKRFKTYLINPSQCHIITIFPLGFLNLKFFLIIYLFINYSKDQHFHQPRFKVYLKIFHLFLINYNYSFTIKNDNK